ncbi:helix-turn-helix domain-containing protein [Bifidobacterium crudilactis]|uniref:helix-turn-helix domain-containing protein n=1 Tax=Bifidobacterium crudilactis TaxID=327277 RepID=UPI002356A58A|nr:helix-turn-helix transcriptional regulator [Bifidobacterium crudilactis]MCI2147951.1 helix-turn-helix domain-containing protein [Bifidobacterium crudilactis]MCI2158685.1 helix-turn-helix domain-containing protein [Bifidobacterium crudilactis]MDN5971856.1 helix-turn-helix domain-containing protein [Bifidobacterium crudilactis]MDN6001125.1 helix-turn-helix domain-containing protein [Bifidobacterium crudilactis]MDN6210301.1 helix-turn-helix domain-containing protein [Bifidobacterium crudilacti
MTDNKSHSDSKISAYMQDVMRDMGITQTDMAKATGRAQSYIQGHLKGESSWKLSDLESLAPLFKASSVANLLIAANDHKKHDGIS